MRGLWPTSLETIRVMPRRKSSTLDLQRPDQALHEFQTALTFAPGRREALDGAIAAAERLGDTQTATLLRTQLTQ
jgi:hypothetical protein